MGFKKARRRSVTIQNTRDFQDYIYKKSNSDIFLADLEASTSICGIKHDSDTLLILPRTSSLDNLEHYASLEFVQFNNFRIGDSETATLRANKRVLARVRYLCFWNAKISDLSSLQFFPNVTHLYLAHIRKDDFLFAGLSHLKKLETLCLLKTPKLTDLAFLKHASSSVLVNFCIENARNLKSTRGIENLVALRYFSLVGAENSYAVDSLVGLDRLPDLAEVELVNIRVSRQPSKARRLPPGLIWSHRVYT